jgi:MFS family permease
MREAAKNLKLVTRNYLAFQVFFALLFWLPVFYEVQKQLGMDERQIFGIQSAYYLAFCLLEIPTGWFADRFGLIRSLRWGAGVLVLAHAVVVLRDFDVVSSAVVVFYAHFLLIALARSLISGASNAYLYEVYLRAGRSEEYVHVEGRARAYGLMTKIVSWSGVGFLTQQFLLSSYWLSLGSALVSVYFATRLPEFMASPLGLSGVKVSSPEDAVSSPQAKKTHARSASLLRAWAEVWRHPRLLGLMIQGMGVFVLARLIQVNLFQPLVLSQGWSVASLGWIMALMTAAEALASLRLKSVLGRMGAVKAVSALTAALAAVVVGLAYSGQWMGLACFILFSGLVGLVGPIQRQVINGAITDSSNRAILLSFESLLDRGATSLMAYLLGIFMAHEKMALFLTLSGMLFMVTAAFQQWQLAPKQKQSPVSKIAPSV